MYGGSALSKREELPPARRRRAVIAGVIAAVALILIPGGVIAGVRYHENPRFCALCHVMEPYLESWNGSDALAKAHADAEIACLDCHESTIEQQINELITYVRGDFKEPLRDRRLLKETCFECHEHDTYQALIERTADYMIDGEKRNPHSPHVGIERLEGKQYECYYCHMMHEESPGITGCYGCHHEGGLVGCTGSDCHPEGEY
jgi:hypothetical protein